MKFRETSFSYDPIGSFKETNPYTIIFVYTKDWKPFVLKGGLKKIESYIERITHPCIIHITMWYHGKHRRIIKIKNFPNKNRFYFNTWRNENIKKYKRPYCLQMIEYENGHIKNIKIIKTFRRIPRKWIKELNPYCKG